MKKYISHSPNQTKNLAKKIAKQFKGGEVLALTGNLGSGKTQFVKGLAEYFGIKQVITSPTFVLLKPYSIMLAEAACPAECAGSRRGIKQLIHVDCYRLDNPDELLAIGLNEYLNNPHCITVIEWAEKVKSVLPKNTIWIKFEMGKKENERIIRISNSCPPARRGVSPRH